MNVSDKLRHLLPHWIEHNDAHAATYQEWAEKAREGGLSPVAQRLEAAVATVQAANRALAEALEGLGAHPHSGHDDTH